MPLGTPPAQTVGFNMPMGKPSGEVGKMFGNIGKQISAYEKGKQVRAEKDRLAKEEADAEVEARNKGITDETKDRLGHKTWKETLDWHNNENANIERARERARLKKEHPGLKQDREEAAAAKAEAKARASDKAASQQPKSAGNKSEPKNAMSTPKEKTPAEKVEEPSSRRTVFLGNTIPVRPEGSRPPGSIRGVGGKYESNPAYAPAMAKAAKYQQDMNNQANIQGFKPEENPMNLPKIRRTMARPNPTSKTAMVKLQQEAKQVNALRNLNTKQGFPKP